MDIGEAGVDYVMFGEPRPDGSMPPLPAVIERASWWAEIFETPCVAYAPDAEAIGPLVETGAEFVALGAWAFDDDQDIRALVDAGQCRDRRLRGAESRAMRLAPPQPRARRPRPRSAGGRRGRPRPRLRRLSGRPLPPCP